MFCDQSQGIPQLAHSVLCSAACKFMLVQCACRNKMIFAVTIANGSLLLLSVPRRSQTARQQ